MAISFVQDIGVASGAQPISLTVTNGTTAGNVVFLEIMSNSTVALSVTDSAGNTYTQDKVEQYNSAANQVAIFSGPQTVGIAAGGTITVAGSARVNFNASEFTSVAATPLDKTASAHDDSALSSAPDSGNTANTTQSAELVIGALATAHSLVTTLDASYTALTANDATFVGSLTPGYRIVAATGAYHIFGTTAAPGIWAAAVATYKAVVLAPPVGGETIVRQAQKRAAYI